MFVFQFFIYAEQAKTIFMMPVP